MLEDLRVANMTRSAAWAVDEPGTNVSQKRGPNRAIQDAGRTGKRDGGKG